MHRDRCRAAPDGRGAERLRGLGVAEALLWVLDLNTRARRFYERDGWRFDGARRTESYGDSQAQLLRYRCAPV